MRWKRLNKVCFGSLVSEVWFYMSLFEASGGRVRLKMLVSLQVYSIMLLFLMTRLLPVVQSRFVS